MSRKILWLGVSGLMALFLVIAACGPAATPSTTPTVPTAPVTPAAPAAPTTPTAPSAPAEKEAVKPAPEAPRYGGTLYLFSTGTEPRFDVTGHAVGSFNLDLTNQSLWSGDWAKGAAGGYGTRETGWDFNTNEVFGLKRGYVAESTTWVADTTKNEGTIIYKIRQGIRWALDPSNEASRLVGGRELTADDVVFNLKRAVGSSEAYLYRSNPNLRKAIVTKTGPWEVTVKLPLTSLLEGVTRLGNATQMAAPEVIQKYGYINDWKRSVGTGPFMLTDVVPDSLYTLTRNPNYWDKDPVGPGKGNQLPYLDSVKYLIIPDSSTQQAALRTGKLDQMGGFSLDDAALMRKTAPALMEHKTSGSRGGPLSMRSDKPPFNDVRVRRAMMMATDFEAINKSLYQGLGLIQTFPYGKWPGYEPLYLALDDPQMPASTKELYVYNPDKAKQLLKEAGYPNGFTTSALIQPTEVDVLSIYVDMWSKVGVTVKLDVRERAVVQAVRTNKQHEGLTIVGGVDANAYLNPTHLRGEGQANSSMVNDPTINKTVDEMNVIVATDPVNGEARAMAMSKELMKYVLDQAWAIPRPQAPTYVFWWPWVKNYSGELWLGFSDVSWPTWVWYDKGLKKSMGH